LSSKLKALSSISSTTEKKREGKGRGEKGRGREEREGKEKEKATLFSNLWLRQVWGWVGVKVHSRVYA
jgi:hypothetical protein